jgi:hypothetical protein
MHGGGTERGGCVGGGGGGKTERTKSTIYERWLKRILSCVQDECYARHEFSLTGCNYRRSRVDGSLRFLSGSAERGCRLFPCFLTPPPSTRPSTRHTDAPSPHAILPPESQPLPWLSDFIFAALGVRENIELALLASVIIITDRPELLHECRRGIQ